MIIKICELILCNQMLSDEAGDYNFLDLVEDPKKLNSIFKLFVYNFYQRELPKSYQVYYQKELNFNFHDSNPQILPLMKTDTYITHPDETIIIDTKFYRDCLTQNFDTKKLISGNIYQMLAYLNHANVNTKLRGILLYPLPHTGTNLRETYHTSVLSNYHSHPAVLQFITLDLSQEWPNIKQQLLDLILASND